MITTMTTLSDGPVSRVDVITSVQRRRRWSAAEKVRLVEEAMQPGMRVSFVARRAGIAPSQLFAWKRRMIEGGHAAVQADEDVVGRSRVRELEKRVRDLERLLGRKTMENEILKEAIEVARLKNRPCRWCPGAIGRTVRDEDTRRHAGCRPIQSDRAAGQGDPISRCLSKSRGCQPHSADPSHHRRAAHLRLSPGLGFVEPPFAQRWKADGQHEAGAPDHAEPRANARTPHRLPPWPHA